MSQAIHMSNLKRVLNQNDQLQVHLRTQQETSHTSASTVGRVSFRIATYRCTSGYIGDKNVVTMDIVSQQTFSFHFYYHPSNMAI